MDAQGDGTVPIRSSFEIFNNDNRSNIRQPQDFPSVLHGRQPFDKDIQKFILETLGIELEENLISTNLNNSLVDLYSTGSNGYNFAGAIINDPVEGFLIDGQGRRLGYSESTGIVTEIPGSFWLGEEDGIGFFTEPAEGPFSLELTGLGEDYFVSVSLETEDGPAGLEEEGFLAVGEQLTFDIPLLTTPVSATTSINAGGNAYEDTEGKQWLESQNFINGDIFSRNNEIAQTEDDTLYQTEYFGNNFSYQQGVLNGSYDVTLKFAEIFFDQAGKRVFDVTVEDEIVFDDFDIYAEAGGKNIALDKTFTVDVTDGSLDLQFLSSINRAKVSAIEIEPSIFIVRTNAGGGDYTDTDGNQWTASEGFSNAGTFEIDNSIAQTEDDLLYQSEHFGGDFDYNLVVENDTYQVTLKFAELFFNDSGKRVFDVNLEGETVLDDFDIYAEAGGKNIAVDKTFTVDVTDNSLDLDFLSSVNKAKVSAIEIQPAPELTPRIATNAGGETYDDLSGQSWSASQGFSNGGTFFRNNEIAQTEDDLLYQSEYFGNNFSYQQDVNNGSYDVTLKFAEIFFDQPGKRVFDVNLEGQTILDDFDIYGQAGGKDIAVDRTFTVGVSDGSLDLDFIASINNAKVSAIEIEPSVV